MMNLYVLCSRQDCTLIVAFTVKYFAFTISVSKSLCYDGVKA